MALSKKDREDIVALVSESFQNILASPTFQPPTPRSSAVFGMSPMELLAIELAERSRPYVASGLQSFSDRPSRPTDLGEQAVSRVAETLLVPRKRKRAKSTFNKAVSQGMKAVKASTSYGKKGTINNAKKAFSAVNKVASKLNRGKKVSSKGPTGVIKRAIGKLFPKKKPVRRTQGNKTKWSIQVNR